MKFISLFIYSIIIIYCYDVNTTFPFYFIWDMDHTVTGDMIHIFSGVIPTHINHPGFGTYLLFSYWDILGYSLGYLSALNINHYQDSISPIFLNAELTNYNKILLVLIVPSIVFFLSAGIRNITQKNKQVLFLLSTILLGSGSGILYHSSMIRSEIFSIFFFSVSFFFISKLKYTFLKVNQTILITLVGVFSGLTLLSKLQSIFYIFLIILLLSHFYKSKIRSITITNIHSILNLLFFLILTFFSFNIKIDPGYGIFADEKDFTINTFFKIFIILFSIPVIVSFIYSFLDKKRNNYNISIINTMNYFLTGFIFSFLFHLVIPFGSIEIGWKYLLTDFKILFIRQTYNETNLWVNLTNIFLYNNSIMQEYKRETILLLIIIISTILLNYKDYRKILFLFGLFTIGAINIALATRFIYRDFLWIEVFIYISILLILLNINIKKLQYFFILGIFILVIHNFSKLKYLKPSIHSQVNLYGNDRVKEFSTVYGDYIGFNTMMNSKYSSDLAKLNIIYQYDSLDFNIKNLKSILKINFIDLKNIGIISKNLNLTSNGNQIIDFSKELNSATFYRIGHANQSSFLFEKILVRSNQDVAGKILPNITNSIPILYRWDLNIFLISNQSDLEKKIDGKFEKTNFFLNTRNSSGQLVKWNCYKILEYIEIPKEVYQSSQNFLIIKVPDNPSTIQ